MKEKINPGKCGRCGQNIHPKEDFCRLTQWHKEEIVSEKFYHVKCFREGMHGPQQQKELANEAKMFMSEARQLIKGNNNETYSLTSEDDR